MAATTAMVDRWDAVGDSTVYTLSMAIQLECRS
jgi:hypothetical protein